MATTGNSVGFVAELRGSATVTRDGVTKVLHKGDEIFADDVIQTGGGNGVRSVGI